MKLSMVAAIGKNRELGKNNKLLWHIAEDLKRFKKITFGHTVIMGRKTFESIGYPLPNRINIVITSNPDYQVQNCLIVNSLEEAIKLAKKHDNEEIFIIGGGQIYQQSIKFADKLYLTIVEGNYDADTFFPDYSKFTKKVFEEEKESDGYKYKFLELEK